MLDIGGQRSYELSPSMRLSSECC